jgi:hypothetical protein
MSSLRILFAIGLLLFPLLTWAQAVQNGEPQSAAARLTGATVEKLSLRVDGVPSISISEVSRELERRGDGVILERPYDQVRIDRARLAIIDLYRALATGPIDVTSYARKLPTGKAEVVFVIRARNSN